MHQPVMLEEVVNLLQVREDGIYVDGTLGSGGHSEAILQRLGPHGRLIGIDRDADALARCRERLAGYGDKFVAMHGNYRDMQALVAESGVEEQKVDGVLMDFGVSSEQLDTAERGFSFRQSGPLDMRMDQRADLTAADIVNEWSESDLIDIFFRYGEESRARRAARAIVERRETARFADTKDLADVLETAIGRRHGTASARRHPATKCFQAIRMVVNDELDGIDAGLESGLKLLREGGRMAVMSFHSLEDRKVKQFLRLHAGRDVSLPEGGSRWEGALPRVKLIRRKAIVASKAECAANPRSRSAKLRGGERCAL